MDNIIDTIRNLIQQHSGISIGVAAFCILLTTFILKKIKTLAIILIIFTAIILYFLIYKSDVNIKSIDKYKKETKEKIMEKMK